jgi:hypothetical protein
MISADAFLATIGPGLWALPWVHQHEDYEKERAAFGIDDAALPDVVAWVDEKMNAREWGWPRIFTRLSPAREFLARFHPAGAPKLSG